ncbi:MAG TPA: 2-C-methyl-D-erythritol 4-phosphate cytidylyltransferase [Candidatus Limnocylindrales bacterium]|nr:2-C-methyl-D-erythritol 4-phosphate cytidylyltransferase [Candidatus Limnocylindrales bacterium]
MTIEDEPPFADAIVVAAGESSRMGGIDKVTAVVGGLPLLAHAVVAIAAAPEVRRIVIVTSADRIEEVAAADWLPPTVLDPVTGGPRRQESVQRGLDQLDERAAQDGGDAAVILVHDGARPLVPTALVSAVARAARIHGAAIPVLPVGDTIKRVEPDGSVAGAGDRSTLGAAQTPQGIRSDLLHDAFARFPPAGRDLFTDEAALLEACRIPVHAIPGDENNFKVTLPADLARVETALAGAHPGVTARRADGDDGGDGAGRRIGFGSDSHSFGPGTGLALGGFVVERAPRLHGHSDGDVVLHAVADALLGAAGLGDLGRIFPAGPETPRGIASAELLAEVLRRVSAAGYAVANLDCTITASRPRLGGLLPSIGARIADLLALDPSAVNVKASSGNLAGMEGAGRGISATAVVILARPPLDR